MKTTTKKLETTIESFLPVFPGFYGTYFEADEDNVISYINDDYPGANFDYDDMVFDYADYNNRTSKLCVDKVEEKLKDLGFKVKIEFLKLVSPRYYNYSNDSIDVKYTVTQATRKQIIKYLQANKEKFAEYCEDNFKSRSGFHSFFEYNVNTWLNEYQYEQLETTFGHMLDFILRNEGYTDYDLHNDLDGQNHLEGGLKPEIEEIIADIKETTVLNYNRPIDVIINELAEKHLGSYDMNDICHNIDKKFIESIVMSEAKEIDNKTLSLF